MTSRPTRDYAPARRHLFGTSYPTVVNIRIVEHRCRCDRTCSRAWDEFVSPLLLLLLLSAHAAVHVLRSESYLSGGCRTLSYLVPHKRLFSTEKVPDRLPSRNNPVHAASFPPWSACFTRPSRDRRRSSLNRSESHDPQWCLGQEVDKLWASVESTRAELAPRKKFAFRNKTKSTGRRKADGGKAPQESSAASGGVQTTVDLRAKEGGAGRGEGTQVIENTTLSLQIDLPR